MKIIPNKKKRNLLFLATLLVSVLLIWDSWVSLFPRLVVEGYSPFSISLVAAFFSFCLFVCWCGIVYDRYQLKRCSIEINEQGIFLGVPGSGVIDFLWEELEEITLVSKQLNFKFKTGRNLPLGVGMYRSSDISKLLEEVKKFLG